MSNYSSKDIAFFCIDGYSVLGDLTDFNEKNAATVERTTVLGSTYESYTAVGLSKVELSQTGFFNDASGQSNAALVSGQGTSRLVLYGVEGNTIGKHCVGFSGAMQVEYDRMAKLNALTRASAKYQGNGLMEEGIILHALGAETAAGNTQTTSVDNAASSSGGYSAYLMVTSLTLGGFTSFSVLLKQSTDNASFTTLDTFTSVTAAPGKERRTASGTVNRYLAVSWSFVGSGSGQSATFVVGVRRN